MKKSLLIRQVRNLLEMQQDEFCLILKVGNDQISKWERNIRIVPDAKIYQLKYYCDKHFGKSKSDDIFSEVIKEIEA